MVELRNLVITFALASVLLAPQCAKAGPILDWLGLGNNPPSSYSPVRYWAPNVARVNDHVHGPKLSVFPPDRHPEVPPTFDTLKYPSAVALPQDTLIPRPTPPASSAAR